MKFFPDCYACLIGQALSAIQQAGVDQATQKRTMKKILPLLGNAEPHLTPAALADRTNQVVREEVGQDDLYREMKVISHQHAQEMLSDLRELVNQAEDPLLMALKVAAAGNVIDVVHGQEEYDLWDEVTAAVHQPLYGKSVEAFRNRLADSGSLLYLADNVGETVFDRILNETLNFCPNFLFIGVKYRGDLESSIYKSVITSESVTHIPDSYHSYIPDLIDVQDLSYLFN